MHFKVRPSTKFSKVFDAYCQRKALQPNAVRFLMDGERLRPDQTPEEMDMEDGDCIDAMMEQDIPLLMQKLPVQVFGTKGYEQMFVFQRQHRAERSGASANKRDDDEG